MIIALMAKLNAARTAIPANWLAAFRPRSQRGTGRRSAPVGNVVVATMPHPRSTALSNPNHADTCYQQLNHNAAAISDQNETQRGRKSGLNPVAGSIHVILR
jgi:hypothetical protein